MEIKSLIIFSMIFLLASCSSNKSFIEKVGVFKRFNEVSKVKALKSFNRKELENINYPLIEIRTTGVLKQALMLPLSQRGVYVNYSSGSGQLITMSGAMVSKTNGINIDLLSVEVPENSPFIVLTQPNLWPTNGFRRFTYANHLNELENIFFDCKFNSTNNDKIEIVEIVYEVTKIIEVCENENIKFENIYWVDSSGFVWKSNQWLNENVIVEIFIIKPLI